MAQSLTQEIEDAAIEKAKGLRLAKPFALRWRRAVRDRSRGAVGESRGSHVG